MAQVGRSYKTEAIVLKKTNYGEADQVVTFYSRHYGKITALAKGVRRLTSRKRGTLEIFSQVAFFAVKGKTMDLVTEVEPIFSFPAIKKELAKITVAYQFCEMVDRLSGEKTAESHEEEAPAVYSLLLDHLRTLERNDRPEKGQTRRLGCQLITVLGYWPKNKAFAADFEVYYFIEGILERQLKSRSLADRLKQK